MAQTSVSTRVRTPTISFTLPLSCQICLGKVKQPCVCPNQHVFCSACMETWLQRNHMCPTCRVPITTESPCKQILGGPDLDTESKQNSSEDSKISMELRRSRINGILEEYENEIHQLQKENEMVRTQNQELKQKLQNIGTVVPHNDSVPPTGVVKYGAEDISKDAVLAELTHKLQAATKTSEKVKCEMYKLKELNKKLRDENFTLSMENGRLKHSLSVKSPKKFEKYETAVQRSHLTQAKKEIEQLKKALLRSDQLIEEQGQVLDLYKNKFGALENETTVGRETLPTNSISGNDFCQKVEDKTCYNDKLPNNDVQFEDGSTGFSDVSLGTHFNGNHYEGIGDIVAKKEPECGKNGPSPAKRQLIWNQDEISDNAYDSKRNLQARVQFKHQPCHLTPKKSEVKKYKYEDLCNPQNENSSTNKDSENFSFEKPSPSTPSSYLGRLSIDSSEDRYVLFDCAPSSSKDHTPRRIGDLGPPRRVHNSWKKKQKGESFKEKSFLTQTRSPKTSERNLGGKLEEKAPPSSEALPLLNIFQKHQVEEQTSPSIVLSSSNNPDACGDFSTSEGTDKDPDSTINHLDYTLTPEVLQCAELMKEAEIRISNRSKCIQGISGLSSSNMRVSLPQKLVSQTDGSSIRVLYGDHLETGQGKIVQRSGEESGNVADCFGAEAKKDA